MVRILWTQFLVPESPELFSPLNGLLISKAAEEKIDKGLILIVPDADHASDWEATLPKAYKIRVLSKDAPGMDRYISAHTHTTWAELDGRRLQFQSNHRPRARYLYFLYCSVILRRSWTVQKGGGVLKDELGRPCWGTGKVCQEKPATDNSRYKHTVGTRGDMLIMNICLYRARENYASYICGGTTRGMHIMNIYLYRVCL